MGMILVIILVTSIVVMTTMPLWLSVIDAYWNGKWSLGPLHNRFCVCQEKCMPKLIRSKRRAYEKKYQKQIFMQREREIEKALEEEYGYAKYLR